MRPSLRLTFLASLLFSISLPVLAQTDAEQPAAPPLTMEQVEEAWRQGDHDTVRSGLEHLARETENPLALLRYGRVLLEGLGGPRDPQAAVHWLQKAVDQDYTPATTLLARLFLTGAQSGVDRDPARAAGLLARSATRGDSEAQYYLALLTAAGDSVPKDETAALNWLLAAAEQQHVEAQYELSKAYSQGKGAPADPAKAFRWLKSAADNNHAEAQLFLAHALDTGQGLQQNKTLAREWYRRAAEQGLPLAQRRLGTIYMRGDGVDKNPVEALRWLTAAAEAGDPGAMNNLGLMYFTGDGIDKDAGQARHWYGQAAETGLGRAMLALAALQETGQGGPADLPGAVKLYRQAAEQNTPGATAQLARLVIDGTLGPDQIAPHEALSWIAPLARDGQEDALAWITARAQDGLRAARTELGLIRLAQDPAAAVQLLVQAAEAGDVRAQLELGRMHGAGDGVAQDYVAAHAWYNLAAASGSAKAAEQRDILGNLLTPDQIAAAQTRARDLFDKVAASTPVMTDSAAQTGGQAGE